MILLGILLSLGAINAMIPIIIILILLVAAAGLNRGYSLFNFFGLSTLAGINPGGKASMAGKTGFNFAAAFIHGAGIGATTRLGSRMVAKASRGMGRAFMSRVGSRSIMRSIKNPQGKTSSSAATGRFATRWPRISKAAQTAKGSKTWQMSKKVGEGMLYKPVKTVAKDIKTASAASGTKVSSNSRIFKAIGKAYQVSKSKLNKVREKPVGAAAGAVVGLAAGASAGPLGAAAGAVIGAKAGARASKSIFLSEKIKHTGSGHDVRAPKSRISILGPERSKNRESLKSFLNTTAAIAVPGYALLRAGGRKVSKAVEARKLATGARMPTEDEKKARPHTLESLGTAKERASARVAEYGGYSNMTKSQIRGVKREARREIAKGYKQDTTPQRTLAGSALRSLVNGPAITAALKGDRAAAKEILKGSTYKNVKDFAAAVNRGKATEGTTGPREAKNLLLHKLANANAPGNERTPQSIKFAAAAAATAAAIINTHAGKTNYEGTIKKSTIHSDKLANENESDWAKTVANRTLRLREMSVAQTKDPKLLAAHLETIDKDIAATMGRLSNKVAQLKSAPTSVAQLKGDKEKEITLGLEYEQAHIDRLNSIKARAMLNKNMPEEVVKDVAFGRESSGIPSNPEVRASAIANSAVRLSESELHELTQKETANVNAAAEKLKNARKSYEDAKSRGDALGTAAAEANISSALKDLELSTLPLHSLASRPQTGSQNIASIYDTLEKTGVEYSSSGGKEDGYATAAKIGIIKNSDTSLEVIAHMLDDKNKEVAKSAKAEMAKRSKKKARPKKSGQEGDGSQEGAAESAPAQESEDEEEGAGE